MSVLEKFAQAQQKLAQTELSNNKTKAFTGPQSRSNYTGTDINVIQPIYRGLPKLELTNRTPTNIDFNISTNKSELFGGSRIPPNIDIAPIKQSGLVAPLFLGNSESSTKSASEKRKIDLISSILKSESSNDEFKEKLKQVLDINGFSSNSSVVTSTSHPASTLLPNGIIDISPPNASEYSQLQSYISDKEKQLEQDLDKEFKLWEKIAKESKSIPLQKQAAQKADYLAKLKQSAKEKFDDQQKQNNQLFSTFEAVYNRNMQLIQHYEQLIQGPLTPEETAIYRGLISQAKAEIVSSRRTMPSLLFANQFTNQISQEVSKGILNTSDQLFQEILSSGEYKDVDIPFLLLLKDSNVVGIQNLVNLAIENQQKSAQTKAEIQLDADAIQRQIDNMTSSQNELLSQKKQLQDKLDKWKASQTFITNADATLDYIAQHLLHIQTTSDFTKLVELKSVIDQLKKSEKVDIDLFSEYLNLVSEVSSELQQDKTFQSVVQLRIRFEELAYNIGTAANDDTIREEFNQLGYNLGDQSNYIKQLIDGDSVLKVNFDSTYQQLNSQYQQLKSSTQQDVDFKQKIDQEIKKNELKESEIRDKLTELSKDSDLSTKYKNDIQTLKDKITEIEDRNLELERQAVQTTNVNKDLISKLKKEKAQLEEEIKRQKAEADISVDNVKAAQQQYKESIAQLEKTISDKNTTIENLNEQIKTSKPLPLTPAQQQELLSKQNEFNQLMQQIATLETELQATTKFTLSPGNTIESVTNAVNTANQVAELLEQYKHSKAIIADKDIEIQTFATDHADLLEDYEKLEDQLLNAKNEIKELRESEDELNSKIAEMKSSILGLISQKAKLDQALFGSQSQTSDLQSKYDAQSKELENLTQENAKLKKERIELTSKVDDLTNTVALNVVAFNKKNAEIGTLTSENAKLQSTINTSSTKITELEKVISANNLTIANQSADITKLKTDLDESKTATTALETTVADLNAQIKQKDEDIETKTAKITELSDQITASDKTIKEKQDEIAKLEQAVGVSATDTLAFKEEIAKAKKQSELNAAKAERLETDLKNANSARASFERKVRGFVGPEVDASTSDSLIKALNAKFSQQSTQIINLKAKLLVEINAKALLQTARDNLIKDKTDLDKINATQIETLTKQNNDLTTALADLKSQQTQIKTLLGGTETSDISALIQAKDQEISNLKSDKQAINDLLAENDKAKTELTKQLTATQKQLANETGSNTALQAQEKKLTEQIAKLNQAQNEIQQALYGSGNSGDSASSGSSDPNDIKSFIEQQKQKLADLNEEKTANKKKIEELDTDKSELESKVSELESNISDYKNEIERLKKENANAQKSSGDLESSLATEQSNVTQLIGYVKEHDNFISKSTNTNAKQIDFLQQRSATAFPKTAAAIGQDIAKTRIELDQAYKTAKDNLDKFEKSGIGFSTVMSDVKLLTSKINDWDRVLTDLKNHAHNSKQLSGLLFIQINELESKKSAKIMLQKSLKVKNETTDLSIEIKDIESQIEDLKKQSSFLDKEIKLNETIEKDISKNPVNIRLSNDLVDKAIGLVSTKENENKKLVSRLQELLKKQNVKPENMTNLANITASLENLLKENTLSDNTTIERYVAISKLFESLQSGPDLNASQINSLTKEIGDKKKEYNLEKTNILEMLDKVGSLQKQNQTDLQSVQQLKVNLIKQVESLMTRLDPKTAGLIHSNLKKDQNKLDLQITDINSALEVFSLFSDRIRSLEKTISIGNQEFVAESKDGKTLDITQKPHSEFKDAAKVFRDRDQIELVDQLSQSTQWSQDKLIDLVYGPAVNGKHARATVNWKFHLIGPQVLTSVYSTDNSLKPDLKLDIDNKHVDILTQLFGILRSISQLILEALYFNQATITELADSIFNIKESEYKTVIKYMPNSTNPNSKLNQFRYFMFTLCLALQTQNSHVENTKTSFISKLEALYKSFPQLKTIFGDQFDKLLKDNDAVSDLLNMMPITRSLELQKEFFTQMAKVQQEVVSLFKANTTYQSIASNFLKIVCVAPKETAIEQKELKSFSVLVNSTLATQSLYAELLVLQATEAPGLVLNTLASLIPVVRQNIWLNASSQELELTK